MGKKVMSQTSTRYGSKRKEYAPRRRTSSHHGLVTNVVQKCSPRRRTFHITDFGQMWSKNVPLVGGLCHITDFDQMWSKNVPLVGGLCHVMDFDQMWSKNVPLVGGLCQVTDFDQMWSKNVPLVGGLCHVMDFDQMWSKNVPLAGGLCHVSDFIQLLSNIYRGSRQLNNHVRKKGIDQWYPRYERYQSHL
jgi:hypothetical protein